MGAQTNFVQRMKGFMHSVANTTAASAAAVDGMFAETILLNLGQTDDADNATFANGHLIVTSHQDCKLEAAYLCPVLAVTNATGHDVVITIQTNGATVATFNSNAAVSGAAAINAATAIGVNTTNSFLDAGEACKVAWTQADAANNTVRGASIQLVFKKV